MYSGGGRRHGEGEDTGKDGGTGKLRSCSCMVCICFVRDRRADGPADEASENVPTSCLVDLLKFKKTYRYTTCIYKVDFRYKNIPEQLVNFRPR